MNNSPKDIDESTIVFAPFVKFVVEFHNSTKTYGELLRTKIQKVELFSSQDLDLIEEAFLVKTVAEWEQFLLNIFTYCVAIDTTALAEHLDLDLSKTIRVDNAYAILNGLNFFNIRSADEIKGLSKKIITPENNPFLDISNDVLKKIDEVYILRNFISHKSKNAKKRLVTMYKNKYQINQFISPGEFLRVKQEDGLFRSDYYFGIFMTISILIWKFLDPNSYKKIFDETSQETYWASIARMAIVFNRLTVENNLLS